LLLFGREFTRGAAAVVILSIGQIINAMMGSVGVLLLMAGYEREVAIAAAISAALNVLLNLIMIPSLGIAGAALAVAGSLFVWNVLLSVCVHRRLGIHTTVLGRI
jgi:O-antigen/teichoic acid export membrane protein